MTDAAENFTMDLEENSELFFKLRVKGSNKESKVRLVIEGTDCSYMVSGKETNEEDIYRFPVPAMLTKGLDEGTYKSKVEVIIEGRYFTPIEYESTFKRPIRVEAVAMKSTKSNMLAEDKSDGIEVSSSGPSKKMGSLKEVYEKIRTKK